MQRSVARLEAAVRHKSLQYGTCFRDVVHRHIASRRNMSNQEDEGEQGESAHRKRSQQASIEANRRSCVQARSAAECQTRSTRRQAQRRS